MSLDKNELELLSAGYLAAAHNDQEELRKIVNKMARKFDHWIVILQMGAKLSLVSIDLTSEKVQSERINEMIWRIGWHGHRPTYSRLNTALTTLRGNETEINRLKDNTKGGVMAGLLTVTGQVIFKKHDDAPELFESEARDNAANALSTVAYISEDEKKSKRVLAANVLKKRRENKSSGGGFWNHAGELLELAGDILSIFI